MAVSKKRGGAKAHAKKVQQRNNMIRGKKNEFQKIMNQQMEDLKKKYEEQQSLKENTQNVEVVSE